MAESSDSAALLARTKLFGPLAADVRQGVAGALREQSYAAGQLIFSRGDPGTQILLVAEGRVRLSVLTAEGRELSFTHAVPGDVFGEIAVLDRSTRSADATALVATRLLALPAAALERLLGEHPALSRAFMTFLCTRLREVSEHLEDIALLPLEARLARYLLAQLPKPSTQSPRAGKAPPPRLTLGMSQGELALILGASRPKVNAALIALEDTGAITRIEQDLQCDAALLSELAQLG